MRWLRILRLKCRALFRPSAVDSETEEELRFHLEREAAELEAGGVPAAEARLQAMRSTGSVDLFREECRDERGTAWIENFITDVRHGVRLMRKTAGFTAAAVLTIAIGIGAATTIFSVVYNVALRPLPYRNPDRIVSIWTRSSTLATVPAAAYHDWRSMSTTLQDIALVRAVANFNLTGDGQPQRINGARTTASLFGVLGVQPLLGRTFEEANEHPGADHVIVLSHRLWTSRFAADPSVVGRTIQLNGEPWTVLGVMGREFRYPSREFEAWAPLYLPPDEIRARLPFAYLAVARVRDGYSIEQVRSDFEGISARLRQMYAGKGYDGDPAVILPLLDSTVGQIRTALYVLLGAVLCLLLTGCANVTNLFLARGLARSRERAVCAALGASATRLGVQAVTEILPVVMLGGLFGIAIAGWGVQALTRVLPASLPRIDDVVLSVPVLSFSLGALMCTAMLVALLPAIQTRGTATADALRQSGRSSSASRRHLRIREALVIAEVAMSILLVAGATLFIRSFARLAIVDGGFESRNVLTLHLAITRAKYPSDPEVARYIDRLIDSVRTLPGVEAAGMVNRLPIAGGPQQGPIEFEGIDLPARRVADSDWRIATPDYFRALGIPIVEGRSFNDFDTATSTPVAIIDENTARKIFPGQSAIGKRVRAVFEGFPWMEVVGVVRAVRHDGLHTEARAQLYWSHHQRTQDRMALAVRTHGDPSAWTAGVIRQIQAVDPDQPVYGVSTMTGVIEKSLEQRRFQMLLLSLFASISLVLASIGIFGVMAYSIQQRQREFGIRLALGARRADLVGSVLGKALQTVGIGAMIGLFAAALLGQLAAKLLYGISPLDPASYATSAAVLVAVALMASYIPARRAAGIDPSQSLRSE